MRGSLFHDLPCAMPLQLPFYFLANKTNVWQHRSCFVTSLISPLRTNWSRLQRFIFQCSFFALLNTYIACKFSITFNMTVTLGPYWLLDLDLNLILGIHFQFSTPFRQSFSPHRQYTTIFQHSEQLLSIFFSYQLKC